MVERRRLLALCFGLALLSSKRHRPPLENILEKYFKTHFFFLLLLALDRYIAVRDPPMYRKNHSQSKIRFVLFFYWILSVGAILPLLIGIVTSWPFPDRYSCQVSKLQTLFLKVDLFNEELSDPKTRECPVHFALLFIHNQSLLLNADYITDRNRSPN